MHSSVHSLSYFKYERTDIKMMNKNPEHIPGLDYSLSCTHTFGVTVSFLYKVLGHIKVALGTGQTQRGLTTFVY